MYEKVLADFGAFLRERRLVRSSSVKHYVRWVGDFPAFAAERRRQGLEGNPEEFLLRFPGRLENSGKHEPWQVGQAKNAVRMYYYQFRKGGGSRDGVGGNGAVSVSDATSRMRELLRLRHYSYRTEEVYLGWVQRFYGYVRSRPDAGGVESVTPTDVRDYMAHLALDRRVSASTQNQAFCALLFLFREVLGLEFGDMQKNIRARAGRRLPTVLSMDETSRLLAACPDCQRLGVSLLYGAGLRLMDLCRLRVKDLDFENGIVLVRDGKGSKDRATLLPERLVPELRGHLEQVRRLHQADRRSGVGPVWLPDALSRKYPNAGTEWGWQYVFPSERLSTDPREGVTRRHHIHPSSIQRAVKRACRQAGIVKSASVHTLRHSFATHLLIQGVNIRQVQEYMGHSNVETTMIYTHVVAELSPKADSPLDRL